MEFYDVGSSDLRELWESYFTTEPVSCAFLGFYCHVSPLLLPHCTVQHSYKNASRSIATVKFTICATFYYYSPPPLCPMKNHWLIRCVFICTIIFFFLLIKVLQLKEVYLDKIYSYIIDLSALKCDLIFVYTWDLKSVTFKFNKNIYIEQFVKLLIIWCWYTFALATILTRLLSGWVQKLKLYFYFIQKLQNDFFFFIKNNYYLSIGVRWLTGC